MNRDKYLKIILLLLIPLFGCSDPVPRKEDYYAVYNIIKVRENGRILNLDTLSQVELTDELYISGLDRDGDNLISQEEYWATAYVFYTDDENKVFIEINNSDTVVELLPHHYYDLLLKRIDPLGNETIMYLKKVIDR